MPPSATGPEQAHADVLDLREMRVALERFLAAAGIEHEVAADAAERSSEAWAEALLVGYRTDPAEVLSGTFDEVSGDLVTVSSIPFVSVCSHHLLPFFGSAHVAYLPGDRLLGLGRIEELVYCLSRRLQLQERLGEQITEALVSGLDARGAACILEAEHLCVFARGKRQRGSVARTVAFAGPAGEDPEFRNHCLAMLGHRPGAAGPRGEDEE